MAFPIIFAGLTGPIPLSDLDQNFSYVTSTFLALTGGTVTGPVVFNADLSGQTVECLTLTVAGNSTLATVVVGGALTANAGLFPALRVVTAAGAVTAASTDYTIVVNKTAGAATVVNLPAVPVLNQFFWVKDGKGDAGVNNITITPLGGFLIDGAATSVLSTNYGSRAVQWNGTQWNVLSTS